VSLFSVEDRERVHARVLALAEADDRVVAGAVVGSLALEGGDPWSDLDLTFAVADRTPVDAVLEDWSRTIVDELDAVHLFDLAAAAAIYRVFLLPGCLQLDLSFAPAHAWGAAGPKFRLLFGEAAPRGHAPPPDAKELLGYAVHHALRARFCIERGRLWQAEYWLSAMRDYALDLACLHRGLPAREGRGFDQLPDEILDRFAPTLVSSVRPQELRRALALAVAGLIAVAPELDVRIERRLRTLVRDDSRVS